MTPQQHTAAITHYEDHCNADTDESYFDTIAQANAWHAERGHRWFVWKGKEVHVLYFKLPEWAMSAATELNLIHSLPESQIETVARLIAWHYSQTQVTK